MVRRHTSHPLYQSLEATLICWHTSANSASRLCACLAPCHPAACALCCMQVTYSIWGMPALRLKALRLRQEVVAISPAMQEVLAPQLKAYLMQLIRQAGEADLYAVAADMLEEFQQLVPAVGSGGGGCEIGGKRVSSMS